MAVLDRADARLDRLFVSVVNLRIEVRDALVELSDAVALRLARDLS